MAQKVTLTNGDILQLYNTTKSITGNNGGRLFVYGHKSVTWNTKFGHDEETSLKGPFIMEFDTQ